MAQTPVLKVYNGQGEYVASCKYLEDAALLVSYHGKGSKVKKGHSGKTLWHEGFEEFDTSESFDRAAKIMQARW